MPLPKLSRDWPYEITRTRTTSNIAFSCFFTFVACAWCCIRPNIPSPYDSKLRILIAKLNILFWVLVCPEVIACWTFRQWFEAGKISEEFIDRGWTRRHALFLMMGGFVLTKDGLPIQTLSPQVFTRLVRQEAIEFPTITTADIQEHSNLHPVLAILALLQAVWFSSQCLSRVIGGLLITQLEVTTLTLVFSSAIIFPFVRQKPLDVGRPVFIPVTPQFDFDRLIYDLADRGLVSDDFEREKRQDRLIKRMAVVERRSNYRLSTTSFTMRCLRCLVLRPLQIMYWDIGDLALNLQSLEPRPGDLKVPVFYVPDSSDTLFLFILPITCTLGMGIGIVHCLYWSWGYFPSAYTRWLWRVDSVITAGFYAGCLVIILITAMIPLINRLPPHIVFDIISQAFAVASVIFLAILFFPFTMARIVLLESFWCMKSLPQEALEIFPWTRFIPHFS